MNGEVTDLGREALDKMSALAATLGTTVEKMYPLLVEEQVTRGIAHLCVAAVLALLLAGASWVFKKSIANYAKARPDDDVLWIPAIVFSGIGAITLFIAVNFWVWDGVWMIAAPNQSVLRFLQGFF